MRKPTALQFFLIEVLLWILVLFLIGYYHDWSGKMALTIFFMKASVANLGVAVLNMTGFCILMATGVRPWRSCLDD